jgi:DNA-binding NarL/FixJ family response regulator
VVDTYCKQNINPKYVRETENISIHSGMNGRIITLETQVEIIKRHEEGNKFVDIARAYEMSESTVRTIIKHKAPIMQHMKSSVPMQSTIISKKRGILTEEMEKSLVIWIEDMQQQRMPISLMLIQEKALSLF